MNTLQIGDIVEYKNPYGVKSAPHVITGFTDPVSPNMPENIVFYDSDSPWFPCRPDAFRKLDPHEAITKGEAQIAKLKTLGHTEDMKTISRIRAIMATAKSKLATATGATAPAAVKTQATNGSFTAKGKTA